MANTKVQSEQIEDGSITADKLADGTIVAAELADNAVETAAINADAVTGAKIADNAIDSEHYTDGSIDTAHIADSQITVGKMAANSVDSDQYVDGSIDTVHIADLQVTTAKIANGNISTAKIADNAVTSAKIDTNIDIAGTFDVTGATTLDAGLTVGAGTVLIGADSGDSFNSDSMLRLQRAGDRVFMQFKTDADQNSGILFGDVDDDVECAIEYEPANKALTFSTGNNAEAIRIDTSGNVLVGQLTASSGTVGTSIRPDGRVFFCADGNYSAHFNRKSSNGAIAHFAKDDTIIGSIGVINNNNLTVGGAVAGHAGLQFGGNVSPMLAGVESDAGVDLGAYNLRWKDLYLSGGVIFDAVAGAATSNTLDDYEEGTWTPALNFGGSSSGITYSSRLGIYTKIGDTVTIWGNCILPNKGSASGNVTISGLPFTPTSGTGNHKFGAFAIAANMASMPQTNTWVMPHSDANLYIRYQGSTTEGDLNNSNFTNTSNFGWTVTYKTNA